MNVFMWEHPCTNCVRPMPLAGLGLGLMWMQVTSFIWVCWSITLLGVDWKWRGQSCHTQHDMGLPLCSVTITTLSGGLIPSGWSRSPEGRAQTSYVPSEGVCIFFFFTTLPWRRQCPGGGKWGPWRFKARVQAPVALLRHIFECKSPLSITADPWP